MRKRPSLLLAVGLVVLIGLVFLGAKYGPAMLDNNHAIPPAENVDPSAEPDETQHPEEPVEPSPETRIPRPRNLRPRMSLPGA